MTKKEQIIFIEDFQIANVVAMKEIQEKSPLQHQSKRGLKIVIFLKYSFTQHEILGIINNNMQGLYIETIIDEKENMSNREMYHFHRLDNLILWRS